MKKVQSGALFPILLAFAACTSTPEGSDLNSRISELGKTSPDAQQAPSGPSPSILQNPRLVVKFAVEKSDDVRAAKEAWSAATGRIEAEKANLAPKLTSGLTLGGSRELRSGASSEAIGASTGLYLDKVLFDGGTIRSRVGSAELDAFIAEQAYRRSIIETTSKFLKLQNSYVTNIRRLDLSREFQRKGQSLYEKIERLTNQGIIDKSVLISADVELKKLQLGQATIEGEIAAARVQLEQFAINPAKTGAYILDPLAGVSISKFKGNIETSPDILTSASRVLLAENDIALIKSQKAAKINLKSSLTTSQDTSTNPDLSVGVQVNWTLSDGGKTTLDLLAAEDRLKSAQNSYSAAQKFSKSTFETLSQKLHDIEKISKLIAAQAAALSKKMEFEEEQLQTGYKNISELINSNKELYDLKDEALQLENDRLSINIDLSGVTGQLITWVGL